MIHYEDWRLWADPGTAVARQYDNLTRRLEITGDLPEGWDWTLLVQADREHLDLIALRPMEGGLGVDLTAEMLALSGYYTIQLRGNQGELARHTNQVRIFIPSSLSGDANWPELPSEFSQAEADIRALNAHPPIPGDGGYWLVWDLDGERYVTSSLPLPDVPVGPPGQAATVEIAETETVEPGTPAAMVELEGSTPQARRYRAVVPQGEPGEDAPQIDDSAISAANPWSSKQIVDTLAPAFSTSGPVVTCNPVEGYPLHVVSQIVPVQEGEGDPSPDNVRPIRGWTEANLWVAGKNLWDNDYAMNPDNWENGMYYALRLPLAPNATYTLSMSKNNMFKDYNPDYNAKFAFYLGEIPYTWAGNKLIGNTYVLDVPLTYTFSTSDKPMYANLYIGTYGESGFEIAFTELLVNLQIEAGSTPTPYTPYNPASKTITLPFGQTVYGGTLDWTTGVLTVDKIVIQANPDTPISSYGVGSYAAGLTSFYIHLRDVLENPTSALGENAVSNQFKLRTNEQQYKTANIFFVGATGTVNAYIGFTIENTLVGIDAGDSNDVAVQKLKLYLSTNPFSFCVVVDDPQTIQLTPQEILALSGTNNIYADTGDVTVSGRADPNAVINNLAQRIAALESAATNL